ncbi:MAG: MFS transporter, partial [Candidatus Bathyarchaeia archaeon]
MRFILMLGLVSLFGDIAYEGARAVSGPYLAILGASAVAVGLAAGLGEFAAYALRLGSGYIADRTG